MLTVCTIHEKIVAWAAIPNSQPASRPRRASRRSRAQNAGMNAIGCSQTQECGAETAAWIAPEKTTATITNSGNGSAGTAVGLAAWPDPVEHGPCAGPAPRAGVRLPP